jgi:hypothetical protein
MASLIGEARYSDSVVFVGDFNLRFAGGLGRPASLSAFSFLNARTASSGPDGAGMLTIFGRKSFVPPPVSCIAALSA